MRKAQATNTQVVFTIIMLAIVIVVIVMLLYIFGTGLQAKTANLPGTGI